MARIHVKFLANIKEAIGKDSLEIDISGDETLEGILLLLSQKFEERLRNVLFTKGGAVAENLVVFVNGRNAMIKNGFKTQVRDGDELIIFTPIAGG